MLLSELLLLLLMLRAKALMAASKAWDIGLPTVEAKVIDSLQLLNLAESLWVFWLAVISVLFLELISMLPLVEFRLLPLMVVLPAVWLIRFISLLAKLVPELINMPLFALTLLAMLTELFWL